MSATNYTYYLDGTQAYPSGVWSIDIKPAWESLPYCRDYRQIFDGELIFTGNDYNKIRANYYCCESMGIVIKCNGGNYWTGIIGYPLDFVFDEDRCEVKCTPRTVDKYSCFDLGSKLDFGALTFGPFQYCFEKTNICSDSWQSSRGLWLMKRDGILINRWLPRILEYMITRVNCTIINSDIYSVFFLNDAYPNGDGGGANNYVTGWPNKLKHLIVSPADEVFDNTGGWTWDDNLYSITWDNAMTFLHNMFNTWWYIDEKDLTHVRIEHINYFSTYFGVSYNLKTLDNGRWIVNSSKFEYLQEGLPYQETWDWANFHSDTSRVLTDFFPQLIDYNCPYHPAGFFQKEYGLSKYSTDIEYVSPDWAAPNPNSVSGLMVLRCVTKAFVEAAPFNKNPTQDWCVWFSTGARYGADHLNAHLSPANLHVNYWTWDRPHWTGAMIGAATNFDSVEYIKKQEQFFFPICCNDIKFLDFIKTQYEDGIIASGNIKDGNFQLELLFENDCKPDGWTQPEFPDSSKEDY